VDDTHWPLLANTIKRAAGNGINPDQLLPTLLVGEPLDTPHPGRDLQHRLIDAGVDALAPPLIHRAVDAENAAQIRGDQTPRADQVRKVADRPQRPDDPETSFVSCPSLSPNSCRTRHLALRSASRMHT
jgi:hypothetical protein